MKRLLFVMAFAGCTEGSGHPIPPIAPFDDLNGVAIGMTAADLLATRDIKHSPYVGYSESAAEGVVLYHFSGMVTERSSPSEGAVLQAVSFDQYFADDAVAKTRFDEITSEWSGHVGEPVCRVDRPATNIAVWRSDELEVSARWVASQAPTTTAAVHMSVRQDSTASADCSRRLVE